VHCARYKTLFVTVTCSACTVNHQNPLFLHRVILKGDGKVAPVQTMKAFTRRDGIAALILNIGTRWSPMINLCPNLFTPGKEPLAHTEWEAPTAGLNIMEKRLISCTCQESNPRSPTLQPSHYNYYAFMALECFHTLQNTGGSGSVYKIYLITYTGRNVITLVRFKCALLLHHTSPTFLWQRAKLVIISWFMGRMWTNSSQWYT